VHLLQAIFFGYLLRNEGEWLAVVGLQKEGGIMERFLYLAFNVIRRF